MEYEISISIPMLFGAAVAIVLGLFIGMARLQDWAAKQINKNKRVIVVSYKGGKQHKHFFYTVKEAAVYALKHQQGVAFIESDGRTVWHSGKDRQSLVNLAKEQLRA